MKLIAGLGNVGAKYVFTRHNAGFMVCDKLALNHSCDFKEESKLKCLMTKFKFNDEDILMIKPTTYMNLSGEAVQLVMNYYKIPSDDIIVIYDDLSLNLGTMRFRNKGSDGGHNGIKSITKSISTDKFARLKIGIGPQTPVPSEVFVLQNFEKAETETLSEILNKAAEAVEFYFKNGIEEAQNKFN